MDKLGVVSEHGQLIISRHKLLYLLVMAGWAAVFSALMLLPVLGNLGHHKQTTASFLLVALLLPLLVLYLYHGLRYLQPWTFVFDRPHDFVTLNDKVACSVTEMQTVHVEKWDCRSGRGSGSVLRLSFLTLGGTDQEVDGSSLYGPSRREMECAGAVIAGYACVMLIKPGY